jgi:hypothetical protein
LTFEQNIRIFLCFSRTYIEALNDKAPDAYLFPTDDTKNHGGPEGKFTVTFEQ